MKKFKKVEAINIPEIDKVLSTTPKENKNFVSKSLEIVHQIHLLLKEKSMTQKSLANKLGKTEAEVSKWLSGTHNFTVRTIALIETAIDSEIIVTPFKVRNNPLLYSTVTVRGSLNRMSERLSSEEKYTVKSKAGASNYELAA